MHGSMTAKVTDESEYSGRRKTLLPRLANSKDWRQWAFKTETILKQEELWYAIENASRCTGSAKPGSSGLDPLATGGRNGTRYAYCAVCGFRLSHPLDCHGGNEV